MTKHKRASVRVDFQLHLFNSLVWQSRSTVFSDQQSRIVSIPPVVLRRWNRVKCRKFILCQDNRRAICPEVTPDPEQLAREEIDALLKPCDWDFQDKRAVNLAAARGLAVRELTFKTGEPDYTLFVDGKAIGTIEAKPAGHSLTGVEE